jgi:TPR repeat protein
MVLVFSSNSQNSDEVKKEIVLAGQCRLTVIPVRVEDVTPDGAFAYELATRQWVDMFDDWERSTQRLVEQIGKVVGQQPGAVSVIRPPGSSAGMLGAGAPSRPPSATSRPASPQVSERAVAARQPSGPAGTQAKKTSWALIGGTGVVAIALIVAALWLWGGLGGGNSAAAALAKGEAAFNRKDYVEAMRQDRQAADQGNARGQTYVGFLYEKGLGVTQDYAAALNWYRKAADQKYAPAQKNIGNLYEQGSGVPRDYAEAMRWYRLAADQGNPAAQTNIGYLYEQGLGVPQDYAEAMRWYGKAAEQGETTAQNNIGAFYDRGYGVTQDYGEAARWYRMAADHGNIDAEYNLALLYADGHGEARDLGQARQWMQKAADAGDFQAKQWLGVHRE